MASPSYSAPAKAGKGVSAYSGSEIKSPSRTPEEQLKTLGGMPPTKSIDAINAANDPSKRGPAPDVSRGT